jgi:hypothetical protein
VPPAWSLLRAGVPISLLCDLLDPEGPRSWHILDAEGAEPVTWVADLAYPSLGTDSEIADRAG